MAIESGNSAESGSGSKVFEWARIKAAILVKVSLLGKSAQTLVTSGLAGIYL